MKYRSNIIQCNVIFNAAKTIFDQFSRSKLNIFFQKFLWDSLKILKIKGCLDPKIPSFPLCWNICVCVSIVWQDCWLLMSINIECRERKDSIIQDYLTLEKTRRNRRYVYKRYITKYIFSSYTLYRIYLKGMQGV